MTTTFPAPAATAAPVRVAPFRLTVDGADLKRALRLVKRATRDRKQPDVFRAVRFADDGAGGASVTCYDLEIAVSVDVPGAFVTGSAAVPFRLLQSAARGDKRRAIRVTVGDDGVVTVSDGAATTRGTAFPWGDLPEIPAVETCPDATAPASGLAAALESVVTAAAEEHMRFSLRSVYVGWTASARVLDVVATDGRRLHVAEPRADVWRSKKGSFLLHVGAASAAVTAWGGKRGAGLDVTITAPGHGVHAALAAGGVRIVARVPEGTFPNWRDVIPHRKDLEADVRFADAATAAKRFRAAAAAIGSKAVGHARVTVGESGLAVTVKRDGVVACEFSLAASGWTGADVTFGCNPEFVADALDAGCDTLAAMRPTKREVLPAGRWTRDPKTPEADRVYVYERTAPFLITSGPAAAGAASNVRCVVMPISLE